MTAPAWPGPPGTGGRPRRSTTRRTLLRLQAALLAATVLALAGCLAVSLGVSRTADAAATGSVPATLAAHHTQVALRRAHGEALRGFAGPGLDGPGSEYQYQITRAGQHLAEIAERNAAGEVGGREVQVVQALLSTYVGLIGQAAVAFGRAGAPPGRDALGAAALLDAAKVLDDILHRLDALRDRQDGVLRDQATSGWGRPAAAAVWLLPVLALLALVGAAQLFLRRRFRRRVSAPLLLAAVLVVLMGAGTAWSTRAAARLDAAWAAADTLEQVEVVWPSGTIDRAGPLKSGRQYVVREGRGVAEDAPAASKETQR